MRLIAIAAAVTAATVDVLYMGIVQAGDPQFLRVPFVASFIAFMAICAALASRRSATRIRPLLLGIAATGLLGIGYVALMSIGLPLIAGGMILLIALVGTVSVEAAAGPRRALAAIGTAIGGCALSIAILLGGFTVSDLAISCPATGQMGGGGLTVLAASYSYSCDNGKLTITR
jgi:hypothetical protein